MPELPGMSGLEPAEIAGPTDGAGLHCAAPLAPYKETHRG